MRTILVIMLLALSLAACGKKPNTLLIPEPKDGQVRHYPRPYPAPQDVPPVPSASTP